jgi:hypothetical protein
MAYTLANLQDDIRNYTEVDSSVLSDSVLSRIIQNAENTITRAIDTDQDRFYATSNLQAGNRYVTIPSDLRAIRYAQLTDAKGNQTYLEQRDTSFMAEYYDTPSTQSGLPKYYANWDANYWVVAPTPDNTYLITLSYDKQPASITESPGSTSGTYLSNKYQDLILYACLVNAYGYLKGPQDMLQYYTGQYDKALESYAIEQIGQRRRDDYQDGVIRAQLISKSPSSNK